MDQPHVRRRAHGIPPLNRGSRAGGSRPPMKDHREQVALPLDVDLSEGACSDLVARVASHLSPGLERSVGPVHWTLGEASGVDWTAEGFVEGALVVVCLRPSSRELSLLVDPRFTPPAARASSTIRPLLGILGASAVVGTIRRSVGWAVLTFMGTVMAWIIADVVRQDLRLRRAIATLDRPGWSRRFQDGISIALNSR